MRLINADKLKSELDAWAVSPRNPYCYIISDAKVVIDHQHTADAVEVVRCKDCRRATECHKSVQYTWHESNSVTIGYSPIDFCSRGERREE